MQSIDTTSLMIIIFAVFIAGMAAGIAVVDTFIDRKAKP